MVGGWATPLKNMSPSVGMMKVPIYGKMKNVPNHQPDGHLQCVLPVEMMIFHGYVNVYQRVTRG